MRSSWYGDGVDINQPTTNLFPILNKINTMEGVANFIQTHPRTVTKYVNQIVDKIKSLKPMGYVHLNALRTLISTNIEYWNLSFYEDSVEFSEAVFKVVSAYTEWLLPAYRPGVSVALYDNNGIYNTNNMYADEVIERFEKSYLPAMLLCTNPGAVDAFITKYPDMRDNLFKFVIDQVYVDRKEENVNLIKEFMIRNFPTAASFSIPEKDYFAVKNLVRKLINDMDVSEAEKMELQRLPIEEIVAHFTRAFGYPDINHEHLSIHFDHAELMYKHLERLDRVAKYERYYGDDAALLFNEGISIFYQWVWEKTRIGDWNNRIVIEERKFIDYISEEYKVDKAVSKLFIIEALEWVDSHDVSKDEILRVQTLIKSGESVSLNPNAEPLEPTFYQWKKDKSDFDEMAAYEESDIFYEEATEGRSRRKTNIRRTAKTEKLKSKAYGTGKDISDAVNKFDTQITGLFGSLKKLFVGDVRSEVIEGKHMTFMTVFKKLIGLCIAAQFGPVKAACALLIRYVMKKKMTDRERSQVVYELDTEIAIITEKINDAERDGNKKAKYAMMRTRAELERAKHRIRLGMGNVNKKSATVKSSLSEGGY